MIWRGVRVALDGTILAWLTTVREVVTDAEVGPDCRGIADQATWDLLLAFRGAGAPMRVDPRTGCIIAAVTRAVLDRPEVQRAMGAAVSAALSAAALSASGMSAGPVEILAGHVDAGTISTPSDGSWENVWLTVEEMARACPPCAERMLRYRIRRVRVRRNTLTGAIAEYERGLRDALLSTDN